MSLLIGSSIRLSQSSSRMGQLTPKQRAELEWVYLAGVYWKAGVYGIEYNPTRDNYVRGEVHA